MWAAEAQVLEPSPAAFQVCISRKLESGPRSWPLAFQWIWASGALTSVLTARSNACLKNSFYEKSSDLLLSRLLGKKVALICNIFQFTWFIYLKWSQLQTVNILSIDPQNQKHGSRSSQLTYHHGAVLFAAKSNLDTVKKSFSERKFHTI